jgi:gp16 family phage-associated protein
MDTLASIARTRTVEEARQALSAAGVSVAAWAKANGFKPSTVAAVLRGERQARIGQSHKIAVTLRIKSGVVADDPRRV